MSELVGWREWVSLPDLGIGQLKAKVDTGARTSALHAFEVHLEGSASDPIVCFSLHPEQRDTRSVIHCRAPLVDERDVRDSGGHSEKRFVIESRIKLGSSVHLAEITLTNRDSMGFRMLLGRTFLTGNYLVDSESSYLIGRRRPSRQQAPGSQ